MASELLSELRSAESDAVPRNFSTLKDREAKIANIDDPLDINDPMAVTKDSTSSALVSKDLWNGAGDAPQLVDVLTQLAHFLEQIGYTKTVAALQKEASKNDITVISAEWTRAIDAKTGTPLLELYELWQKKKKTLPTLPAADDNTSDSEDDSDGEDESEDAAEDALVDVEAEETSDDDSDEKSESDGDSSSDEVDNDEMTGSAAPDKKRKRSPSPASSDDSSSDGSDSSSDESQAPPAKKAKVKASATSSSNETSSSKSDSSSSSSESDSGSDSSSDSASSDSSSDSSSESSSDSSSDSSSESESEAPPPAKKEKVKKEKKVKASKMDSVPATVDHVGPVKEGSTASSATLEGEDTPNVQESHIHPSRLRQVPSSDPAPAAGSANKLSGKKEIVPFSRIPVDQKVDPRFASNAYVSYDYADRAHQDLIVTKGKGFTKEKNKKKRGKKALARNLTGGNEVLTDCTGAYRGGAIDLTPKGIKFDD